MLKITKEFYDLVNLEKAVITKNILIKSSSSAKSVESSFLNDIMLTVIIESTPIKERAIEVVFFTLDMDIESLVRGYFGVFFDFDFKIVEKHKITIQTSLCFEEITARIAQKDFMQSCEQITLHDKQFRSDSIILPFNSSKAKISQTTLQKHINFFAIDSAIFDDSELDSAKKLDSMVLNESGTLYKAKILFSNNITQSFDVNPKNAIYKALGKMWHLQGNFNFLDSVILINFRLEIDMLKILLLYKCTFIICKGKPSFNVIKYAQKFGVTVIAFIENDFLIITHTMRFMQD